MKTILLVDCEPIVRSVFKWELTGQYEVVEAASVVTAIDVCRARQDIDLLICRAELGFISGMELGSLLRAWLRGLRIIVTADQPPDTWTERQQLELQELPDDEVVILERPFTGRELKVAIAKLLPAEVAVSTSAA